MKNTVICKKLPLNNSVIQYFIRYSNKAKYLQLRITSSNQLELVIPKRYSLKEGEKFLLGKLDWIKKYQTKLSLIENDYLFFGSKIETNHTYNLFSRIHKIRFHNNILSIESPADSKTAAKDIFNIFLRKNAKSYLPKRTLELAKKFEFKINRIGIRGQKSRWGSCSLRGNLSFNYKLLQFRKEIIDYVIIHELCHLKEMNHSIRFWNLVKSFCPDYKILRKELKR